MYGNPLLGFSPDELLNQIASPSFAQNARRKWTQKIDELVVTAGQNVYQFYQTPLGNQFIRNARFPISGNEVFFVTDINAYTTGHEGEDEGSLTIANFAEMSEILARSYLEILVNDRVQLKVPLMEILGFWYQEDDVALTNYKYIQRTKHLLYPIIMNSNANVSYRIVLTDIAVTELENAGLQLVLYGIQFDKLDTFYYDIWKGSAFQKIDFSMYDVQQVLTAGQTTYNLFQNRNAELSDYSKFLPLSDIERFDVNAIEVGFFNPDDDITPEDFWENRRNNVLQIQVEDVLYFDSHIKDLLTISQVETAVCKKYLYQNLTLKVPITLPAKGNIKVTLTQPAGSVFDETLDQHFICDLKGVITRRVV